MTASPQMFVAEGRQPSLDLLEILYFLWRRWILILAVTATVLLVTGVWLFSVTPLYTASTQILIDPRQEKEASPDAASQSMLDVAIMDNQIALVKSTQLLRRVVERERLVADPEFGSEAALASTSHRTGQSSGRAANPSARGSRDDGHLASRAKPGAVGLPAQAVASEKIPPDVMASIGALEGAITAKRVGQADVLGVSVASTDPVRAARLANAVADAYLVDPLYARFEAAQRASVWLNERLADLGERLRESEEAVVAFRTKHNLVEGGASGTLNQDQLTQLNARLVMARADVTEKKSRVELLQKLEARGGNAQGLPEIMNSGLLVGLRTQLAEISRREADLAARYSGSHPQVVSLRAERADVQRAVASELRKIDQSIHNDYALALARQESLERALDELRGKTHLDNQSAVALRELERTASVNKSVFEDFLQRARITQEQSTFQARLGRVIVPALPPAAPSSPRKTFILSVALAFGLTLGAGGAWAMEKLNVGFTTSRQVEDMLALPVLAWIGQMDARETTIDGVVTPLPRYVRLKPLSGLSQSLRALRRGVQMADVNKSPKVVQVTSALSGEGKTTTSLTLAVSAAGSGLKTLIIDADSRRPSASSYFGLHEDAGLAEVLLGEADIEAAICFNEAYGVWVLPVGRKGQNAAAVLDSERMRKLVEHCRAAFDYTVFDTPAVGQAVDPRIIADFVDKIIVVVNWGVTAREAVYQAVHLLPFQKKVAGVVFNFVNDRRAKQYGRSTIFPS